MSRSELGVAVVGAGLDHWSGIAHVPAISALDGMRLRWLVTSTPESAAAASAHWGFDATAALDQVLDDDAVHIVAVTVRVPRHAELVEAAIAAGKHVYCEWPLALDSAQAATLAALSAKHPDRVHITGLQGRFSPHLRLAAAEIAAGRIGRPLAANLRLYLPHGLIPRPAHRAHLRHRSVGANVLTIQAGHTLDMINSLLGRPQVIAARLWSAVPEFLVETGERLARDAPDNLVAVFDHDGVVTTTHFSQTGPTESFGLDILGASGQLRLTATGQPQFGGLTLDVTELGAKRATVLSPDPVLSRATPLPENHPGYNVSLAYAELAAVIRGEPAGVPLPDFGAAVDLHELLGVIASEALTSG
jgi:predicted dehydrogenase